MEIVVVVLLGFGEIANISRVSAFFAFIPVHLPDPKNYFVIPFDSVIIFYIHLRCLSFHGVVLVEAFAREDVGPVRMTVDSGDRSRSHYLHGPGIREIHVGGRELGFVFRIQTRVQVLSRNRLIPVISLILRKTFPPAYGWFVSKFRYGYEWCVGCINYSISRLPWGMS